MKSLQIHSLDGSRLRTFRRVTLPSSATPSITHKLRQITDSQSSDIPERVVEVEAGAQHRTDFCEEAQLVFRAPDIGYIASDGSHTQHARGFSVANHEVLIRNRDCLLRQPMPKEGFALPLPLLDYRSDDDVRGKRALIRSVILKHLCIPDGIIGWQADHPAAGRIDVNGLPAASAIPIKSDEFSMSASKIRRSSITFLNFSFAV